MGEGEQTAPGSLFFLVLLPVPKSGSAWAAGAGEAAAERLAELRAQGLLLHERVLEGPTGARARFDGREVINLASNNYLGLANHPDVVAAVLTTRGG